jgi:hypothetical protein
MLSSSGRKPGCFRSGLLSVIVRAQAPVLQSVPGSGREAEEGVVVRSIHPIPLCRTRLTLDYGGSHVPLLLVRQWCSGPQGSMVRA